MMELNLNNVEQKLIKDDFLKQEALMYREKYRRNDTDERGCLLKTSSR